MSNYFDTLQTPVKTANFHYFRIAREKWNLMLIRISQLGLEAVTLPVLWNFHQLTPTTTDITGITNARRNLVDLMAMCQLLNLRCVLNLGPYHPNLAILGNGLPHWVVDAPDTLSPAARQWYQTVAQGLTGVQWPQGPIIALQLDSEERMSPGYPTQLTEIQWPIWLRKRYKGVDALNTAYGANYRSVNDVTFPEQPGKSTSPLAEDAQAFLAEHLNELQSGYMQAFSEAGWQVPIFTTPMDLSDKDTVWATAPDMPLLTLSSPIQTDPDPPDIAAGPVWATDAPIRADGWLRKQFWLLRQQLWAELWSDQPPAGPLLIAVVEGGGLISAAEDTPVRVSLPKGSKPAVYRLGITGKVATVAGFSVSRGWLTGHYVMENGSDQTDFIFYLENPTGPLNAFLAGYLSRLLLAQANTLQYCAKLAAEMGQMLTLDGTDSLHSPAAAKPGTTPYSITEARRGLNEAEAALKKAMAAIGGLESGFGTILGKRPAVEPVTEPLKISPGIFEGAARDVLLAAGERCAQLAPSLQAAAETILAAAVINTTSRLTLETYQHNYALAVTAAGNASVLLIEIVAQLRQQIATEQLPLVTWQVHNQLQAIVDGLRWGVAQK